MTTLKDRISVISQNATRVAVARPPYDPQEMVIPQRPNYAAEAADNPGNPATHDCKNSPQDIRSL